MSMTHPSQVHVDQVLGNLVLDYASGQYIANRIFPIVQVKNDTGKYYKWGREQLDITELTTRREDMSEVKRVDFSVSLQDYTMEQHALGDALSDTVLNNADDVLSLRETTARKVIDVMDRVKEKAVRDVVFTASTFATANTEDITSTKWSTTSTNIYADIRDAQEIVKKAVGVIPNKLVVGWKGFNAMKENTKIIDSVKYVERSDGAHIKASHIAAYLGLDEIIVGDEIYNSAAEGLTVDNEFIWGEHALLFFTPPRPAINIQAFGYELRPTHTPRTVERYRKQGIKGEFMDVNEKRFIEICMNDAAFLFQNAFTA